MEVLLKLILIMVCVSCSCESKDINHEGMDLKVGAGGVLSVSPGITFEGMKPEQLHNCDGKIKTKKCEGNQ